MTTTPVIATLPEVTLAFQQPIGPTEPEANPSGAVDEPTNAGLSNLLEEVRQSENVQQEPPAVGTADATETGSDPEPNAPAAGSESATPSTLFTPPAQGQDPAFSAETTAPASAAEWIEALQARFEGSPLPGMMLAVGVLIMMFIMMRRLARRSTTPKARSVDPAEHIAGLHDRVAASTTPIDRSISQAEETTRRLAAMLDNKADRIDLLIQEADAKLIQLNNALAQVSRNTPVSAGPLASPAEPERHSTPRSAQRKIDPGLLDRARIEQDRVERSTPAGHTLNLADPESPSAPGKQPDEPRAADPTHRRIWELSDDGLPPVEIARTLNQPIGQIELILNLRRSG
ncbi:MAG: hypothetical protein AAGA55_09340 [Planctomycetota bacterium]